MVIGHQLGLLLKNYRLHIRSTHNSLLLIFPKDHVAIIYGNWLAFHVDMLLR